MDYRYVRVRARAQADRFARPDERTDGYSGSNARNGRRNAVDGRIDLSACVPSQNRTRRYGCALKGRRRYSVFHVGNDKFLKSRRAYLIVFVRKRVERTSKVSLQRNGQFALHASPHPCVRLCVRNALAYVAGRKISITRGMRYIAQDCKYFKPTIISVVPSILKFLVGLNALNDELRMVLVGAGPANEQTLAAAKEKGIEVRFGYGLTETSSGVAISCGENPFAMSVCPDDTITLADDGEVLVKADECMMKCYYKNPKATKEVLINGILHTGDLGKFDEDGNLYITGRKKIFSCLKTATRFSCPNGKRTCRRTRNRRRRAHPRNGEITLFVGNKDGFLNVSMLKDKLAAFNKTSLSTCK